MRIITQIWSRIINNGINDGLKFEQAAQVRIANAISVAGALFALGYAIFLTSALEFRLARNDLFFIANILMLYLFNYLRLYRTGIIIVLLTLPLTLILVNYEYGKIGTEYFFYPAIVFGFYFFKHKVNQYLNALYYIMLILIVKYLETVVTPEGLAAQSGPYILISNIFMSSAILLMCLWLFVKEHKKYLKEINEKNAHLSEALAEARDKTEQVNMVLRELHHRVKNNLQMVSSLFNIQSYKIQNSQTRKVLEDARNRIVSIAIMHQKLYKENIFHEVMLKSYIDDLVEYLVQSVGTAETVKIGVAVENIRLRIEDTVHVGLIVNELVTNAIKYGGDLSDNTHEIKLRITLSGEELKIAVKDKGPGFPTGFSIEESDSFGLELVNTIVNQHEGSIAINNNEGAQVDLKLKFPEFSD